MEYRLEQKGKLKELEAIKQIGKLAKFAFVRQTKPLGDGHAVLSALPFIDSQEPVAVLFGDDIIDNGRGKPALRQLMDVYEKYGDPVTALMEVPKKDVSNYGVIDGIEVSEGVWEISQFVEKPEAQKAPSNLVHIGREILTPDILALLPHLLPGVGGEIRLADAFAEYIKQKSIKNCHCL